MRAVLLAILWIGVHPSGAEDFFTSRIEPLLREHCLECHSHDTKMKGGLALDSRSGWAVGGNSGPAIVPGKPEESLLMKMVRWTDEDHRMPPKQPLPAESVTLLEEWIRQGAPDPRQLQKTTSDPLDWWSLQPLQVTPAPSGAHPIDGRIRERLAREGLSPSPRADRRTLIRRLSLDLHGLLPTPEEVQAFVQDPDPAAWEKLVDRYLHSPRYGERWARHWLDTVHFADSHGCEHDVKRPHAWRYRDYVIDRLNADVPWNRFIREQLAVDVFYPDETQLIPALGFISAGPLELSRAGTAPITFDYLDRDDIVTQTMAAFASTTANCARCHTHKFDPISQEDYYSLQAVFAGVGKGDVEFEPNASVARRRQELQSLLTACKDGNADILLRDQHAAVIRTWEANHLAHPVSWEPLNPDVFIASGGATLSREPDGSILAHGELPDQEQYTVTAPVPLKKLSAIRLDAFRDERLPMNGPGRAANGNFHLADIDLKWFPRDSNTGVDLAIAKATADYDQEGWTSAQAFDEDLKSGWAIFPRTNESHHIVFELKAPLDLQDGGRLAVTLKQLYPPKHQIGRFLLSVTEAPGGAAKVISSEARAGLAKPVQDRSEKEQTAIAAVALREFAEQELLKLPPMETTYAVSPFWSHAKRQATPIAIKPVHVLKRGDFFKPGEEASPGTLSALSHAPARFNLPATASESARRAALADWLAHPDNPLTWRSVVNRVWQFHFGRGLSDTPDDFGRMGSPPTHPDLLDALALWFRNEARGSLKELHRLILTSETWCQTSQVASGDKDTDNLLLWRMNRRRLDAEAFRDSALQMAGRLDGTMGGPGIEQFSKTKGPQATPALNYSEYDWNAVPAHRRSIYRVVWRGIPDPFMEALDFPDLALLAPKRGFSVSALQSLAIYNNAFVLNASQWLADRVSQERSKHDPIAQAVQLTWQREPTQEELDRFQAYAQKHGLPALCRVLFNSNEFLFID